MKGIVFTEFLEMVEESFGIEVVDAIIKQSQLASEGVYTAVGTYSFSEMQSLLHSLSQSTHIPERDLLYSYGSFFFNSLYKYYRYVFNDYTSAWEMLTAIEDHIHVHVRKIYPDAELPSFQTYQLSNGLYEMVYKSDRCLYMFAKALIEKTFEFFGNNAEIQEQILTPDGSMVRFLISVQPNDRTR